jgi:hypothetical protein
VRTVKLFNLDAHCSVITDDAKQLQAIGHEVDSHNLTGHHWVMGLPPRPTWGKFKLDFIWDYTPKMAKEEHGAELAKYDGFLGTFPPLLMRLFQDFGKPMFLHMPVRYDFWTSNHEQRWRDWHAWFCGMYERGRLHVAANSLFDVEYCRYFTGIRPLYIQSLCDYTGIQYRGDLPTALLWDSRSEKVTEYFVGRLPNVQQVRKAYGRYDWATVARHKAIIHVPYNASIMSIFEHYAMGIPIFVPSPDFMLILKRTCGAIGEIAWRQCANRAPAGSFIPGTFDAPDPNEYDDPESLRWWMRYWDCYNLPHIQQFDSLDDLEDKLSTTDLAAVSARMIEHNKVRKLNNHADWTAFMVRT